MYVDDLLFIGIDAQLSNTMKEFLDSIFSIKDLNPTTYFLGVKFNLNSQGLYLTQR